ncbi:DUF3267 domain-containing protein [Pyrococcus sp. ST04]|uniref:DUF3267 domain-containing protein n=1 Tax=Pyrococcus sp. ST04 TaxID=1183377 RepID=UPI0002605C88|nr:DUF3267 domain-containing protein [Pyrococcus sp. ST04]AFK22384.1 putative membrane-associated metallopeptidase [Pyrococcus sp. ST04]
MERLNLEDYMNDIVILYLMVFLLSAKLISYIVGDLVISVKSIYEAFYYSVLPLLVVVILHEGMHALVVLLYGGKIRVGTKVIDKIILTPYVATDSKLPARKYLKVALAPLALSLVAIVLAKAYNSLFWSLVFIYNTAGFVGDLLVVTSLLKMPREALVWDSGTSLYSTHQIPRPYSRRVSMIIKLAFVLMLLIFSREIRIVVETS